MSTEENKAVVRRVVEEWNKGNRAVWSEITAPDCVIHSADGRLSSRQEMKQFVEELERAFPDHHLAIEGLIAEGDKVVALYTDSGTMKGSFMGMEATGKRFTVPAIEIYRFAGGKIVEAWEARDMGTMMQQLAVTPPPEQPGG